MTLHSVLLVDDEPDIRRIGEVSLRAVGQLQVWLASGADEAVALARSRRPDVILLDVMMPGTDGPTTLTRLRGDEETAGIPVIFMTAKVQRHEVERYLALGAIGVVCKPFDPMTLAAEIRALVDPAP